MTGREAYHKFCSSRQEALRLQIALKEWERISVKEAGEEKEEITEDREMAEWLAEYRSYLERRRRSAVEVVIREGDLAKLQLLDAEGLVDERYLEDYRRLAAKEGQVQLQWWLLFGEPKGKACSVRTITGERKTVWSDQSSWKMETDGGEAIWALVQKRLMQKFPFLSASFCRLKWQREDSVGTFGTDGEFFYYKESWTKSAFQNGMQELIRGYFHTVLHCLYFHVFSEKSGEENEDIIRDIGCDIMVEYLLDKRFFKGKINEKREKIYSFLERKNVCFFADKISDLIRKEGILKSEKEEIRREFSIDCHDKWDGKRAKKSWEKEREVSFLKEIQNGEKVGLTGGYQEEIFSLKKQRRYDYKTFLKRFSVFGEEVQTDWEQFDYIPYVYSRENYENLVFLEPLEYAEVHKLQELVIAIDTSGSCRGAIVKQFLEETYQILSHRENFFEKMRVHIIQCDSMIQGYVCIENEEQWKAYGENPKVQGFGGTDFRPVFEYVEKLRKEKQIRNIKGLIYFTDGDGIFPERAADYETAFVFLNQDLEKQEVPGWAVKLNLNLKVEREEE